MGHCALRRAGESHHDRGVITLDELSRPENAEARIEPRPERDPAHASPPARRALRDPLILGVLVLAFAADQLSKGLVVGALRLGESWPAEGFFRLTFVRNTGTAFGFFQDQSSVMTVVSLVAVALIVFFYRHAAMASPLTRIALGLQIGGAFGNLLDRLTRGYVVDFIDVGPWPVFNVADSAIVTGIAGLLLYFTLLTDRDRADAHPVEAPAPAPVDAGPPPASPPAPGGSGE